MTAYLVLAARYRPTTFSEVVGQDHAVQALSNSIVSGRVAHAFLLCGVRGVWQDHGRANSRQIPELHE